MTLSPRESVKNLALSLFEGKGGEDFTSISSNSVRAIFNYYDDVLFDGAIQQKAEEEKVNISFLLVDTSSDKYEMPDQDVKNLAFEEESFVMLSYFGKDIDIEVAPNLLADERRKRGMSMASRLDILCACIEEEIITVMIVLWQYEKYGLRGKLYDCMYANIFPAPVEEIISTPVEDDIEETYEPYVAAEGDLKRGFTFNRNSCYIDSLLTVLLGCSSNVWRDKLLKTDVSKIDYEKSGACSGVSGNDKIRAVAANISKSLNANYADLTASTDRSTKCTNVRMLLTKCLPGMRGGVPYRIAGVYTELSLLFNMSVNVDTQIFRRLPIVGNGSYYYMPSNGIMDPSTNSFKPFNTESLATFGMWDYLDSFLDTSSDYSVKKWAYCNSDILVFSNEGAPHIKDFGHAGAEQVIERQYGKDPSDITVTKYKVRHFGETIINDRYRLVGAIILAGVSDDQPPDQEGGYHYVAYFRDRGNKIIYYNDMRTDFVAVPLPEGAKDGTFPESVFKQEGGNMPSMYFYEKIKNYDNTIPAPLPYRIYKTTKLEAIILYEDVTLMATIYDESIVAVVDLLNPAEKLVDGEVFPMRLWRASSNIVLSDILNKLLIL